VVVVNTTEDPSLRLARRLRSLRQEAWPGIRITQEALGEALGASAPLISSWESMRNPKTPPPDRLEAYATFFATRRSVAERPYRVLTEAQLTDEERTRHEELFRELTSLRNGAQGQEPAPALTQPLARSQWHFPPDQDITIVGSAFPAEYTEKLKPFTDPEAPDYVELLKYADLDALLELFGHIRAANPLSNVRVLTPDEVTPDTYTSHLVLLGGVDWNPTTADLLLRLELPVRQLERADEDDPGGFEVGEGEDRQMFKPVLRRIGAKQELVADVAHFFRAPNPFNAKRTVSLCNGMYQRGTLGVVRALTDVRFRDRNEQYLRARFDVDGAFSIISRVNVVLGSAVTPDWTQSEDVLHEWPGA
jgi:transcriptional regulator with XRE-family HTH domain